MAKQVFKLRGRVCNLCGKELDVFDAQENFTIHKRVGYGSVHDGEAVHLQLCCDCFDKLVEECVVSPAKGEFEE